MAGDPIEYLLLPAGEAENFSQYTAGGASDGSSVRTEFAAVRLDLETLTVDMADYTFATSSGALWHSGADAVEDMPFGVAMSCTGYDDGVAQIDLMGTPLAVDDDWAPGGYNGDGSADFTSGDQVVEITGGGYCGWNFPGATYNPFNDAAGFDLQLTWAD